MKFIIATNNPKKLVELKRILNPLGVDAVTAKEAGISLDEVEETGTTFAQNAMIKAEAACKLSGMPAIADDSGLCVDALNGAPGVYSARYAGENATDADRISKLLDALKDVSENGRTAHFVSSICCVFPNGDKVVAEGKCCGNIAFEPDGDGGFGYDPVFVYNGVSFGKLTAEEKDKVSHRGNALREFKKQLKKYLEENNVDK
jgi:XTP/dITP diphosphohydrolase